MAFFQFWRTKLLFFSWTIKISFAIGAGLENASAVNADLSCFLLRWPKVKPGELFCRLAEAKLCQGWQIWQSDHEEPLSQVTADLLCLAQPPGLGGTFWHSQAPGIIHNLVPTAPLKVFQLLCGWNVLFTVLFSVGATSVWCFKTGSTVSISERGHHCWPSQGCKMWRFNHFLPLLSWTLFLLCAFQMPSFSIPITTPNSSFILFSHFFILLYVSLAPQLPTKLEFCFRLIRNLCLIVLAPYFSVLKGYPGLITFPRKCSLTVESLRNGKYFVCCWNKKFLGFPRELLSFPTGCCGVCGWKPKNRVLSLSPPAVFSS